jgi:hypothetical protein
MDGSMSESSIDDGRLLFLSQADMWPSEINARFPGARFVARARVPASDVAVAAYFSVAAADDIWGVLISAGDGFLPDRTVTVTTDDGRKFAAGLAGETLLEGDPQGVLSVARYWELPPRFIAQLKSALQAGGVAIEDEEPRDDGNLG